MLKRRTQRTYPPLLNWHVWGTEIGEWHDYYDDYYDCVHDDDDDDDDDSYGNFNCDNNDSNGDGNYVDNDNDDSSNNNDNDKDDYAVSNQNDIDNDNLEINAICKRHDNLSVAFMMVVIRWNEFVVL